MDNSNISLLLKRIEQLNTIGIALSAEKNTPRLLETILLEAKSITNADGGSLYTVSGDGQHLNIEIMRTDSLNFAHGGTTGNPVSIPPIPLYLEDGSPNTHLVSTSAVLEDKTISIPDAYTAEEYDFSGTRDFDAKHLYRSRSFLTIPMKNHENDIIGVLQLINAKDPGTEEIISFTESDRFFAESLASQAAVVLTNKRLIDELQNLFEALVKLVATAIDEKSPYTGSHCKRVPAITKLLADAAHNAHQGPFKDFILTDQSRYELEMASWLHDCGKITTPEHVMDKATKLETVYDRMHTIDTRFEIVKRDLRIRMLEQILEDQENGANEINTDHEKEYNSAIVRLEDDLSFLHKCNSGGEYMPPEDKQRVKQIGAHQWTGPDGKEQPLLSDNEIDNLSITRGTLTQEERNIINYHVTATIKILESLPFPKHLANVLEYAAAHHEKINGKGYPYGLAGEQISVHSRIMAIADIFEALTNCSRPYKVGMTLSQALSTLQKIADAEEIDKDLLDIFITQKVYLEYAKDYLQPEQIDIH